MVKPKISLSGVQEKMEKNIKTSYSDIYKKDYTFTTVEIKHICNVEMNFGKPSSKRI